MEMAGTLLYPVDDAIDPHGKEIRRRHGERLSTFRNQVFLFFCLPAAPIRLLQGRKPVRLWGPVKSGGSERWAPLGQSGDGPVGGANRHSDGKMDAGKKWRTTEPGAVCKTYTGRGARFGSHPVLSGRGRSTSAHAGISVMEAARRFPGCDPSSAFRASDLYVPGEILSAGMHGVTAFQRDALGRGASIAIGRGKRRTVRLRANFFGPGHAGQLSSFSTPTHSRNSAAAARTNNTADYFCGRQNGVTGRWKDQPSWGRRRAAWSLVGPCPLFLVARRTDPCTTPPFSPARARSRRAPRILQVAPSSSSWSQIAVAARGGWSPPPLGTITFEVFCGRLPKRRTRAEEFRPRVNR